MAASLKLQIGPNPYYFEPQNEQSADRQGFYTALLKTVATLQSSSNETLTKYITEQSQSHNGTSGGSKTKQNIDHDGSGCGDIDSDDDQMDDGSDGEYSNCRK